MEQKPQYSSIGYHTKFKKKKKEKKKGKSHTFWLIVKLDVMDFTL